jgi:hypothetical protein
VRAGGHAYTNRDAYRYPDGHGNDNADSDDNFHADGNCDADVHPHSDGNGYPGGNQRRPA